MPWLGDVILDLIKNRDDKDLLFGLDAYLARRQWLAICEKMGVEAHMYQLRHTGPSRDALANKVDAAAIMAKGRWQTTKSVKRYSKPGGLQRVEKRLSNEQVAYGELCVENLEKLLRGQMILPPPSSLRAQKVSVVR
eukprot:9955404-Karenia_brevis.AAC.1